MQLFIINKPFIVLTAVIYRPPKYSENFISDFADFLSRFTIHYERILIVGDFNIHICCDDKPLAKDFVNVLESFNLTQSVSEPTHQRGHVLDLVLSYGLSLSINEIRVLPVLDHSVILFDILAPLSVGKTAGWSTTRTSRYIGPKVLNELNLKLPNVLEVVFERASTVDSLTESLNDTLKGLLDRLAPARTKKCPQKICRPWLNDSLISLRKNTRKLEQQWRHSKLEVYYRMLHESLTFFQASMSDAKAAYYSNLGSHSVNSQSAALIF